MTIAEIVRLENNLPEVFATLKFNGRCYVVTMSSPGKNIKAHDFWDVFEEQTLKKDSGLIIAKIAFGLVMRLIRKAYPYVIR